MKTAIAAATLACVVVLVAGVAAQTPGSDDLRYTAAGELVRPARYREWVFLSSGLNMTYGPNAPDAARNQPFNNVFVNRAAYAQFMETGRWPEKTIFILEIRRSEQHVRPNTFGYTQAAIARVEAAVKDTAKNGSVAWAYYSFDGDDALASTATPLPQSASCQQCHSANAAVEQTFVQFYPTLFAVAKAKGTVKPAFDPRAQITAGH